MNERIKQFARQSGATDERGNRAERVFCFTEPELKQFAELIVRECIDIAKDVNRNPYLPDGEQARQIIKNITKHFGVGS